MTVEELIRELQKMDKELPVYLSYEDNEWGESLVQLRGFYIAPAYTAHVSHHGNISQERRPTRAVLTGKFS